MAAVGANCWRPWGLGGPGGSWGEAWRALRGRSGADEGSGWDSIRA